MRICYAYLDHFGKGIKERHSGGAVASARDLLLAGEKPNALMGDTLHAGYIYARVDGDWTDSIRELLLKHYRSLAIEKTRKNLSSERDTHRMHAYNLLKQAEALEEKEELLHHLRNYFIMTSYSDQWKASHEWLDKRHQEANWDALKLKIDLSAFSAAQVLNSWGDKQEKAAQLISTAFFPEMKDTIVAWAKDPEQDNLRYNAYEILKKTKHLAEIDLWDFHKTTLTTFSASYELPRDFKAALAFFTPQLKGEKAADARAVLEASKAYILDYIEVITKNGFENRTRFCRTNIKAIDALLNPNSVSEE